MRAPGWAHRGVAFVAAVAWVAACGGDGRFDRGRALDDLQGAGLTRAEAECVVDRVTDQFGLDILSERREPTADESGAVDAVKARCVEAADGVEAVPADPG